MLRLEPSVRTVILRALSLWALGVGTTALVVRGVQGEAWKQANAAEWQRQE